MQSPKSRKLLTLGASNHHPRLVLGGKVESGKITAYSGSAPKRMIFDGSLPVAIPMPAFDHYLPQSPSAPMPEPAGPIFHGHGIIWTGSVEPRPGTRQIELYECLCIYTATTSIKIGGWDM
ncbi:hypothetical protein B566_EDAN009254 [Ephemera danica]|nr:hypothetical protein B566_EDAN009254 [Ephemera danica]